MQRLHWKYVRKIAYVVSVFSVSVTSMVMAHLFLHVRNPLLGLLWIFITVGVALIPLNLPRATDNVKMINDE